MGSEIGQRIRELRMKAGMTQAQLAEKLCVTFQAISRWETGKTLPDIECLSLLSDVLGVSIDYLIRGKEFERPHQTGSHWAVILVNNLIAPISLNENGKKNLIKIIEGYDVSFVQECILDAYRTYVKSQDSSIRKEQVETMLKKLCGVFYNHSLSPTQQTINRMVHQIAKRTGEENKKALYALKKAIHDLLIFQCGENATESDMLKALNEINETYLKPSGNVWGCRYKIKDFLSEERDQARLQKRIQDGFFPIGDWPDSVDSAIKEANEMLKAGDQTGLMISIYRATSSAIRLMIEAMPAESRPHLEEDAELRDYADLLYDWLGRRLGKNDASYVKTIATFVDDSRNCELMRTEIDYLEFSSFMHRLFRKYGTLKK